MIGIVTVALISILNGDPSRYFIPVETQEQAEAIAEEINGDLISYNDGIATYTLNRPLKGFLRSIGIDTYGAEETAKIDGVTYTLSQDSVMYPDDFESGCAPKLNSKFVETPFKKIEWENTYKNGITGENAVVAVIDTGCDIYHEDLREQIIGGYNSVDGTAVVTDVNGHGTHVAGTVLARDNTVGNVGVAPDAKLYVIKASTHIDSGKDIFYTSDVVKALNKAIDVGYINVVNMSLGGAGYDQTFKDAMNRCMDNGILCVVAAGNDGTDVPHYPAAFEVGLRVAAYDPSKKDTLAYFSNYGINANIAAPGTSILSTYKDGKYMYLNGTSMASPHVAGVAALVYGAYNIPKTRQGAEKVMNMILSNNDGINYAFDGHYVKGGVDVQKITNAISIKTPATPVLDIEEQADTGQSIVTLVSSYDIIYTLDGSTPSVYNGSKYTGAIRLDRAGTYKLRAIAITKRCSSKMVKKKIVIPDDVISEERIESVELRVAKKKIKPGKSEQIDVYNMIGNSLSNNCFSWKCNKPEIATVDKNGVVTVAKTAESGAQFTIKAKLGDVTKKIKLKVK